MHDELRSNSICEDKQLPEKVSRLSTRQRLAPAIEKARELGLKDPNFDPEPFLAEMYDHDW